MESTKETLTDEKVYSETDQSEAQLQWDEKAEKKLTMKLDLRLVPVLGLLYLITFLDRTNIANARIQGLEKGLNMPANGYNTSLWVFYIPFVLVEIPSNIIMSLPKIKPNLFLGGQMFILGICSMCQGLTGSYGGLLACRFLMGIFEAGLPSGAALLLSSYYQKKSLVVRFAWFFVFAELGPAFSGLLAYAIVDMDGTQGLAGWRWIFILEGIVTIAFSIIAVLVIPSFPHDATFITEEERAQLLARLHKDRGEEKQELKKIPWIEVLSDYKIWLLTLLFFCVDMSAASISSFNPTILTELGWTSKIAQVISIPIWIWGICLELSFSYAAARFNMRWPFILGGLSLQLVGWSIQLAQVKPAGIRYFAQFCIASGTFSQFPLLAGLLASNLRGRASLAVGTALQIGLGNCANFVASNVFITSESPRYPTGFGTGLGVTCLGLAATLLTLGIFAHHNRRYDAKEANRNVEEQDVDNQRSYRLVL